MNRLILISPDQGSGFKPILSGNFNRPLCNPLRVGFICIDAVSISQSSANCRNPIKWYMTLYYISRYLP